MPCLALRVLKPPRLFARKTENQNIRPAVRVKILGEGDEVFRVSVVGSESALKTGNGCLRPIRLLAGEFFRGRIILVALGEFRRFIPIRAGDHIQFAVAVEIANGRAFAPKLIRELLFLERRKRGVFGRKPTVRGGEQGQN